MGFVYIAANFEALGENLAAPVLSNLEFCGPGHTGGPTGPLEAYLATGEDREMQASLTLHRHAQLPSSTIFKFIHQTRLLIENHNSGGLVPQ